MNAAVETTEPYTDEEVELILAGCLKAKEAARGYGRLLKTFRLLLEFMLETGMRVGDAVLFDPAVLSKGEYSWIYIFVPQKTRKTKIIVPSKPSLAMN